ncbi:MAG: polysaccharide biosynthesis C-terminal domain-containing protein [Ilumatobacteraceae bacterium]
MLGDDFEGTEQVIKWLSPVVVLRGVGILPLNGLIGLGRTMARTGLLVGGAVVSMGYYLWLIPGGSWRGAAQATILAECTLLAASWLVLLRAQRRADEQHLAANPDADAEIELAHLTDVQEENF